MNHKLPVGFRADASASIGTGHIMRCLTLAKEMRNQGITCYFFCRHIPESLAQTVTSSGHILVRLIRQDLSPNLNNLEHASWLGVNQIFDAQECLEAIKQHQLDWMIVDHYALDHCWEEHITSAGLHLAVIDDLADRGHNSSIFINQNLIENPLSLYADKLPKHCRLLVGPKYALLRDEFLNTKGLNPVRTKLANILVFFGGVDADNLTSLALDALNTLNYLNLTVDAVIGSLHPDKVKIQQICEENGYHCHIQTNRMAKLMAQADLAIGAGGSASWERAYLGLPTLIVSVAKNQTNIAKSVGQYGAAIYLGEKKDLNKEILRNEILYIHKNPEVLQKMSQKCLTLCDGQGKHRIIKAIQTYQ